LNLSKSCTRSASKAQLGESKAERTVSRVRECGCDVTPEWHAAYRFELDRRKAGKPARPVRPDSILSESDLIDFVSTVIQLAEVVASSDYIVLGMAAGRPTAERQLVQRTDALVRINPSLHRKIPAVRLTNNTLIWARQHGFILPRSGDQVVPESTELAAWLKSYGVVTNTTVIADVSRLQLELLRSYSLSLPEPQMLICRQFLDSHPAYRKAQKCEAWAPDPQAPTMPAVWNNKPALPPTIPAKDVKHGISAGAVVPVPAPPAVTTHAAMLDDLSTRRKRRVRPKNDPKTSSGIPAGAQEIHLTLVEDAD
jgi:hypothetical protein